MAKRSLILTSTAAGTGKKLQKTITDINPNADGNALKGFTQKLNAMTTNTYVATDCIDKFNIDTEVPPVDTRQTPTLSVSGVPSLATIKGTDVPQNVAITYDGDGITYMKRKSGCNYVFFMASTQNTGFFMGKPSGTQVASVTAGTFIVGAYGTENYKPIEIEVTFE